jgi:hypothetical protein
MPITSNEFLNGANSQTIATEKERNMSKAEVTVVDFTTIAQYGELWTKQQLKFSDPRTDVQSHVLLADNPPRKLCFNTYNGALGKKKSKVENGFVAQLQAFKDNTTITPDGTSVYPLKVALEDARKRLTKTGYAQK